MIGFPFDSKVTYDEAGTPSFDRAVSSAPLRKLIHELFSNGVMPNPSTNLQVTQGDGMTVVVKSGFAIVNGCMKLEEADRTLIVQASSTSYDRIDTVVLRLNDDQEQRTLDLAIHQGVPSSSPVRPDLTRTGSIYEIGLADLYVAKNTTTISPARITDTRYESSRCGIISSISEFDTTTLYNQIQSDLEELKVTTEADFVLWYDAFKEAMEGYFDVEKEAFENWFDDLQIILDGNVAGHLQNEIDDIRANAEQSVHLSSLAEYEALPESTKRDGRSYYVDTDDNQFSAKNIAYDNTESGLQVTDVQGAIDELNEIIDDKTKTTTNTQTSGFLWSRCGNVVNVNVVSNLTCADGATLINLPSPASINATTDLNLWLTDGSSGTRKRFHITSSGDLKPYGALSNFQCRDSFTYICR